MRRLRPWAVALEDRSLLRRPRRLKSDNHRFYIHGKLPLANLFDTDNVPTTEPATIVAVDLLQWKRTDLGTDQTGDATELG